RPDVARSQLPDVGPRVPAAGQAERLRGHAAVAPLLHRDRRRLALVARRAQGARGERAVNFIRALGLRDVVLMNVVAVVGMGWIAFAFARFGSATAFTAETMVPRGELLDTIGLWSAMCFAFSGFEITSLIGQEIKDPERTIPRGILIAGAATTIIYVAGSASVLVAVP